MMISQTLDAPVVFDIPDFDDDASDYELSISPSLLETPEGFRSGFVALLGSPNVGKSTLLNHLGMFCAS